ncbi:MAG: 3-deoxy-7-phosphoheptulonate synthase [Cryptosporangiaceae bacterium]|nr:3-deoxy-7-phosphoheptulonate synthase [Cryptosporangiaceae bacterium]
MTAGALSSTVPTTPATAAQQPDWPDAGHVRAIRAILRERPPLVAEGEIRALRDALGRAAGGGGIVLQAGDCAELFDESGPGPAARKIGQLSEASAALRAASGLPVTTLGRIAGQYAKPRSAPFEQGPDGGTLPSYRGDAVHGAAPDPGLRVPDPRRLLTAYGCAASTLAELRRSWATVEPAERVYASHELLLLDYEQPLVRDGEQGPYAGSAHFGWIGERTRGHDGAHLALAASISNPVGVKLGPGVTPGEAVALCRRLDPDRVPGRLTFIVRMGSARIATALPPVVAAVARHGSRALWISDPMHGNTIRTRAGHKTRATDAIAAEITEFTRVLRTHGQWPGGIHLELTPDDVTECVTGPATGAWDARLPSYRSACDPRLNPEQAAAIVRHFGALL